MLFGFNTFFDVVLKDMNVYVFINNETYPSVVFECDNDEVYSYTWSEFQDNVRVDGDEIMEMIVGDDTLEFGPFKIIVQYN